MRDEPLLYFLDFFPHSAIPFPLVSVFASFTYDHVAFIDDFFHFASDLLVNTLDLFFVDASHLLLFVIIAIEMMNLNLMIS